MIVGVGIDTVEVERIAKKIRGSNGFKEKVFTEKEISYCESVTSPEQSYSARFCAKEAFLKATGKGLTLTLDLNEIEITHDEHGKPFIELHGQAKNAVLQNNWKMIHVSLSHTITSATAIVIIEQ